MRSSVIPLAFLVAFGQCRRRDAMPSTCTTRRGDAGRCVVSGLVALVCARPEHVEDLPVGLFYARRPSTTGGCANDEVCCVVKRTSSDVVEKRVWKRKSGEKKRFRNAVASAPIGLKRGGQVLKGWYNTYKLSDPLGPTGTPYRGSPVVGLLAQPTVGVIAIAMTPSE